MEEMRRARDEYALQFVYDLDAIFADLMQKQQESGARVVTLPRRPAQQITVPRPEAARS